MRHSARSPPGPVLPPRIARAGQASPRTARLRAASQGRRTEPPLHRRSRIARQAELTARPTAGPHGCAPPAKASAPNRRCTAAAASHGKQNSRPGQLPDRGRSEARGEPRARRAFGGLHHPPGKADLPARPCP